MELIAAWARAEKALWALETGSSGEAGRRRLGSADLG